MLETIKRIVNFIKIRIQIEPDIGIILGTGLGGLINEVDIIEIIPYKEIPGFPISTVEGHSGNLYFGTLNGKNIVVMQGRFHYYEGYSAEQITLPIRVMKYLGIKYLFVSNASGGINPEFETGDLMIISDHICLIPNPLIGGYTPEFGPRFPDMANAYDHELIEKAKIISKNLNINIKEGIYVATTGPTYETPAEYKYFRVIGGDAVGMSTAPEIIIARQMEIKCFAISIITDLGIPGKITEITHEEVQKVASAAESKMTMIFSKLIKNL